MRLPTTYSYLFPSAVHETWIILIHQSARQSAGFEKDAYRRHNTGCDKWL